MKSAIRYALSEIRENFSSVNWWRNRVVVPYALGTATRFVPGNPGYDEAVHVMDEDWDNLVILDACRADVFKEVAEMKWFDDYRREISLGSHSGEWTEHNFSGKEFGDTVYVSANPHTEILANDSFHELIELRESEFDEECGTVLPETMVEKAVEAHERHPHKRLIIHFMQPHGPFVYEEPLPDPEEKTPEEYWERYRLTLEYVLDHVKDLVAEIDGKTVISADHGQTYDETMFGISLPTHPPRFRTPELVTVPWATINSERREIREGEVTVSEQRDDLEKRLEHLGYR